MHCSALALLVLLFQTLTTATVGGRAVDPGGAPIPGATVVITDTERNQIQSAVTSADGRYRFPPLPPGSYTLTATLGGMKTATRTLRLTVGQVLEIPVTLSPTFEEIADIFGAAPAVETTRTQVAATVTPEEVRELPLNGRNYLDLALLAPGVSRTNTGPSQRFAETSAVPGTGISVSTQRNLNNSFLVDGLSANDDAAELAGTFFSQEVIREFQVIRSAGVAEFGRASGGVINVVTRTGTNAFRGDAYAFYRNDALDADNPLTGSRLPLDQKQYGVSLGGPLIHDRMFFFGNIEQLRQRGGGVITIAPEAVPAINARLDAAGYRGARLTTGAFDTTLDSTNVFLRADQNATADDQLTLRLNTYDVDSANARNAGGLNALSRGAALGNRDRTLAANNLAVVSKDTMAETRAQITRSRLQAPTNDTVGPAVNIAGIASFGVATFSPIARDIDLYELAQNGSWYRGEHAFKAGLDLLRNDVDITFPGALQGVYTFRDLPSFLAGNYASYQQAFGEADTHQRNDNVAAFVQDEWRVTPRLTINAGLRYDVQRLPSLVHTDRDNLSPRLAVAWDVRGDGRSVLRAGAGIYYDRIPLRAVANALQRNGVTYRIAQVGPGALAFPNVFTSFPAGLATNVTTIDPDIGNGRSEQAMLQYERQLGARGSIAVGYEHLRGRDLIMSRNINAPPPSNNQYQSVGDSWYDGLTLAVNWRPALRLAYTFSKGLDTSGNFFFSTPQDNHDIRAERGRSDNDQRHRLALSGTLDGPAGVQLSYVYAYTSALPFNIQLPNDRNGDANFNDRPPGVGRNTGRGFDYRSLDLRLSRRFGRVEAIVDAFNVFNRANYQAPNNIITSPTFGRPTAASDPRQVQAGLRVTY
ncbi:MAG TPA: TonB-dependent receptor [Thermoanaerobaculia bacterium]|nr:TonB-dependent receptor [Thermoanaerobaculia bacterium]